MVNRCMNANFKLSAAFVILYNNKDLRAGFVVYITMNHNCMFDVIPLCFVFYNNKNSASNITSQINLINNRSKIKPNKNRFR